MLDYNFPKGSSFHKELEDACERYSDLRINFNECGGYQMCSAEINEFATHVDFSHTGALYIACPYIVDNKVKIYSDPPMFIVGIDTVSGFGISPYEDGLLELSKSGLSSEANASIKDYLARRPPIKW